MKSKRPDTRLSFDAACATNAELTARRIPGGSAPELLERTGWAAWELAAEKWRRRRLNHTNTEDVI